MPAMLNKLRRLAAAGMKRPAERKLGEWNADMGDWVSSNRPGNVYSSSRLFAGEPGTSINYAALVGDLWRNSAVQACLNWLIQAWPEAKPIVEEMKGPGQKPVPVTDHPILLLLQWPNTAYDDTVLWAGTVISFWVNGNAYWGIQRQKGGDIGGFVYIPHERIRPMRLPQSKNWGPDFYEYDGAQGKEVKRVEDVVHFRFGIDPNNDLLGMSPWASIARNVYTDNEAINYQAVTLKNSGAAWMIVSKKSDPQGVTQRKIDVVDVKNKLEANTTGDNRNRVSVIDADVSTVFPPAMKDQGIDSLHRIPETRICACAGLSPISVGLASGLERSTFENTQQGDAVSWRTVRSVQRMMGRQATQQILRSRDPNDAEKQPGNFFLWEQKNAKRQVWIGFDYSEVPALQPDKTEEWKRVGQGIKDGLIDEDEGRAEIGYKPKTEEQRAASQQRQDQQAQMQEQQAAQAAGGTPNGNGASQNGTGKGRKYDLLNLPPQEGWVESAASRIEAELEALHGEAS